MGISNNTVQAVALIGTGIFAIGAAAFIAFEAIRGTLIAPIREYDRDLAASPGETDCAGQTYNHQQWAHGWESGDVEADELMDAFVTAQHKRELIDWYLLPDAVPARRLGESL